MNEIEFVTHRPDPGGGGSRVPSWLREAPGNAEDLKGVMGEAASSIDGVASTVGSKTESALPSVYQSVGACEASTYGSELTESLGFLGEEFGVAKTRLGEYATDIGDAKDRAVDLDRQISAAISDYADAIRDKNSLPDDAEDTETQAAEDVVRNRRAETERLQGLLAQVLEEARGLDRSYAAQLDAVTGEIQDTANRLGEISGSIRNGASVTVALTSLKTEIDQDSESMPLSDDELAEQHAQDLQEAMDNEDWDEVERILAEMEVHNDNPDYAEGFTRELGAVGAADLLEAAQELDDQETIRVVDVVNDTLMNGLAEYDTDEVVEWVDNFVDADGDDLDVLPLLLATLEGDGRVHAYSSKYFFRPEYFPTLDYDLLQELLPGFDLEESDFEELLALAIDPDALIDVLNEVDGADAEYIFAVLFPFNTYDRPYEERQKLLIGLLDRLGNPDSLGEADVSDNSADTLLHLLEWLNRDEIDYHVEAIRIFLNDPENLYYVLEKADNSGEWAEVVTKLLDGFEEAGGVPEELVSTLMDYLEGDGFDPERAGEKIGLLLALIEQSDVDYDPTKLVMSIIDAAAGAHKVAGPIWSVFKGILESNAEYQEKWENFISDAQEDADFSAIAFFLLMSDTGTMRDDDGNPITDDLEEFLAEYGLDRESFESDPEAAQEALEELAENPERIQDMIDHLKTEYPNLEDALFDIEDRIHHGNNPGDDN